MHILRKPAFIFYASVVILFLVYRFVSMPRLNTIERGNNSTASGQFGNVTSGNNAFDGHLCDSVCKKLQSRLSEWPKGKPKAFIYYLTLDTRLQEMIDSLGRLDRYFNDKFHYPVVIFHENKTSLNNDTNRIMSATRSELYFQTVNFQVPEFLPRNIVQRSCHRDIGYRHMCRFHAKLIYEQPIIRGFEFVWRLDDDSKILGNIEYDVFQHMQNKSYLYGYVFQSIDSGSCVMNLWESAEIFIKNSSIRTTFFKEWPRHHIFYNNFEVSRLSIWLSHNYQQYMNFIDSLGGIYYHRWGDAPIKSIAVSMFVPRNQTHQFHGIRYSHQHMSN